MLTQFEQERKGSINSDIDYERWTPSNALGFRIRTNRANLAGAMVCRMCFSVIEANLLQQSLSDSYMEPSVFAEKFTLPFGPDPVLSVTKTMLLLRKLVLPVIVSFCPPIITKSPNHYHFTCSFRSSLSE